MIEQKSFLNTLPHSQKKQIIAIMDSETTRRLSKADKQKAVDFTEGKKIGAVALLDSGNYALLPLE